ncbi:MAG: type II toxin-antitoxin system HicA family toxin [Spirochaetaceae bacterium]|nr:type II toxin-antitoxin system HicA family toxin [Spirochaetaceae bacterium]
MTGKQMLKFLESKGFKLVRINGSHHVMQHSDGRGTVVPIHGKDELGKGLKNSILKQAGLKQGDI